MDTIPRGQSVASAMAAALRDHILFARLRPHDTLPEMSMAQAFGVGRSHAREALRLLEDQKLVRRVPQSGNYVTPISSKLVHEGAFMRQAVEEANVRRVSGLVSAEDAARLSDLIDAQQAAADKANRREFHTLDEAFHKALFQIGGRAHAWDYLQPAKLHVDRARIATLGLGSSPDRAIAEHRAILSALVEGDTKAAVAALDVHLHRVEILLERLTELEPTYVDLCADLKPG
ncbi:GntR family transcriptional regulator [Actibacterium mucosum]|uniref:GntR family transcriptional regulator n=1 Tax=Actibacterium mucosum TaxID=1087332 RepID=UPI0013782575|nr:GntR family transcriptional regulator [Actibacterium mucosum]